MKSLLPEPRQVKLIQLFLRNCPLLRKHQAHQYHSVRLWRDTVLRQFTPHLHTSFIQYLLLYIPHICNYMPCPTNRFWCNEIIKADEMYHHHHHHHHHSILDGKFEGKRSHRGPRLRWLDNIRMNLRETEWEGVHWKHLAQDRDQWWALVNTVMNSRVP
jgi:hypothetical protein